MIKLEIPVDKIPYIRSIEGRKFHNGKWQFPDSAIETLQKYGLIENDIAVAEKKIVQYELSPHLRSYQRNIVNQALNDGCYGIFSDTGTGKTIMGLEIAAHYPKTLILCPLSVIETAWIDDCRRFYPDIKIVNVWSNSREKRIKLLYSEARIYAMNYESFKILKNEIRNKGFDCIIVDESSVMKNMTSQITNDILETIDYIPHRFVLSGTPTPNHNSEIFPQMKLVDKEIFGNNYYGFLAKYFTQDMADPHHWFQTQENKEAYFKRLDNKSVFLKKDDCVDLPEKTFEIRRIKMNKDQQNHYDNMVKSIKDNINCWSKFEFTAKLMKLREILSGFTINKDETITDFPTEKDNILSQALEEIGDKPVIVWCQFIHEIERLSEKFNGTGLTSKSRNRDEIIRQFKSGDIKLLFAHPQLLGKGLTFTDCNYNIYYSLSFSYEEFKQSQDRIHRIGQSNKCTYIILQAQNTIDEKIYSCLQRKGNAVDELYMEMGLKTLSKESSN